MIKTGIIYETLGSVSNMQIVESNVDEDGDIVIRNERAKGDLEDE